MLISCPPNRQDQLSLIDISPVIRYYYLTYSYKGALCGIWQHQAITQLAFFSLAAICISFAFIGAWRYIGLPFIL